MKLGVRFIGGYKGERNFEHYNNDARFWLRRGACALLGHARAGGELFKGHSAATGLADLESDCGIEV